MRRRTRIVPGLFQSRAWFLSLLILCLTANAASGAEKTLVVSAAISLKDALTRLAVDFEKHNGQVKILYNFGSTGQLRTQIENGAPADVFASASAGDMDKLSQKGMIIEASRVNLVANRLVLIKNSRQTLTVTDINDLTTGRVQRIAIGNPDTVPAGQYARDSLSYYHIYDKLKKKLIFGENVRQVLDYVARGEVDTGLVYATDALIEKQVTVVRTLPEETHKPIIYPIAVIQASQHAELAGKFIAFIHAPENFTIFREYGFEQGK